MCCIIAKKRLKNAFLCTTIQVPTELCDVLRTISNALPHRIERDPKNATVFVLLAKKIEKLSKVDVHFDGYHSLVSRLKCLKVHCYNF